MDISGHEPRELIMTLSEVAVYLKVAQKTVHRMIGRSEIPAAKIGKQWRFYRPVIDDWIVSKMSQNEEIADGDEISIGRFARSDHVLIDLPGQSRRAILENLIAPLVSDGLVGKHRYLGMLLDRERMLSTAVGKGIAFPHVRHPEYNPAGGPYLLIGISKTGIDYGSPDGTPVRLFALFAARNETDHLRGIAALSNLFDQPTVAERIVLATTVQSILSIIKNEEEK